MKLIANCIHTLVPGAKWLSFPDEVDTFGHMMMAQTDMTVEAHHLNQFIQNFKHWSYIGFPTPILDLCSREVLVETYVNGIPMSKFMKLGPSVYDRRVSQLGLSAFLVIFE